MSDQKPNRRIRLMELFGVVTWFASAAWLIRLGVTEYPSLLVSPMAIVSGVFMLSVSVIIVEEFICGGREAVPTFLSIAAAGVTVIAGVAVLGLLALFLT